MKNYCTEKYCGVANDTIKEQLEDFLFVAEETCTYLLGNALVILFPESQEDEKRSFVFRVDIVDRFLRLCAPQAGSQFVDMFPASRRTGETTSP